MRSVISISSPSSSVELSRRLASRSRSNLRTYSRTGTSLSMLTTPLSDESPYRRDMRNARQSRREKAIFWSECPAAPGGRGHTPVRKGGCYGQYGVFCDCLICGEFEVLFWEIKCRHILTHQNPDQLFLRVDPVIGLCSSGPAEFSNGTRHSRFCDVQEDPRPQAKAVTVERYRADGIRQQGVRQVV